MKLSLALAAAVLLTACSDRVEEAKKVLESQLADRKGVEYRNLETFPGNVVCGEFSGNDYLRGTTDFQRFIVRGTLADNRPSADDWHVFCTEDSASALLSRFGIGPLDEQKSHLEKIRGDITALDKALDEYLTDNYTLPNSEQGLAALTSPSEIDPHPRKFRPGGYLSTLPLDPWGTPYRYQRSGLGGVAQTYSIYTLGADGVEGGQGADADVSSDHFKYLDHINQ